MNKISIFLLLFLCCFNFSLCDAAQKNQKLISESELGTWGYREVASGKMEQSKWEQESFGKAEKHFQKIRAREEVPNWPSAYYRFTIIREDYPSETSARVRSEMIYAHPPGGSTKMEPEYVLRQGFLKNNSVYIVSTDVVQFKNEELPRILRLLKKFISNK